MLKRQIIVDLPNSKSNLYFSKEILLKLLVTGSILFIDFEYVDINIKYSIAYLVEIFAGRGYVAIGKIVLNNLPILAITEY